MADDKNQGTGKHIKKGSVDKSSGSGKRGK